MLRRKRGTGHWNNMKKIHILLLLVLAGFLAYRAYVQFNPRMPAFQTITIGGKTLHVEVARTAGELSKRVGDRDSVGSDGVVFLFSVRLIPTFLLENIPFVSYFLCVYKV